MIATSAAWPEIMMLKSGKITFLRYLSLGGDAVEHSSRVPSDVQRVSHHLRSHSRQTTTCSAADCVKLNLSINFQ